MTYTFDPLTAMLIVPLRFTFLKELVLSVNSMLVERPKRRQCGSNRRACLKTIHIIIAIHWQSKAKTKEMQSHALLRL